MDNVTQEIIILGSTGTIGSKLAFHFMTDGYITHCLGRDYSLDEIANLDKDFVLINCAFSFSGSLEVNKKIMGDAIRFTKINKVSHFLNISSIDAYSNQEKGFGLECIPDTVYGKLKRDIDIFIDNEIGAQTNLHYLILGALTDCGSTWSRLIKSKYINDRQYYNESIPTITLDAVYKEIQKINNRSSKHIIPRHEWLPLRELYLINLLGFQSRVGRIFMRNKFVTTIQKIVRKLGLQNGVQSDLFLFESLAERSKNFDA